ncbi:hypothetical protein RchiOBHm_Chr7g0237411 [Rosa chinensis]|uniref:Uncharacterized protein n=1 Tax=Rosa chinensis TaxID=74649 RepID=A0A2P6PH97_ROSCH|nr:hypothetical protein RchiOBHm_Chr7g0237411 [Rosa chinensis]
MTRGFVFPAEIRALGEEARLELGTQASSVAEKVTNELAVGRVEPGTHWESFHFRNQGFRWRCL